MRAVQGPRETNDSAPIWPPLKIIFRVPDATIGQERLRCEIGGRAGDEQVVIEAEVTVATQQFDAR